MINKTILEDGVKIVFTGSITPVEVAELKREINSHPDFCNFRYQFVVFDSVNEILMDTESVMSCATVDRDATEMNPDMRIYFVVNNQLSYGFIKMYQSYYDDFGWDIRIFENEKKAMEELSNSMGYAIELDCNG